MSGASGKASPEQGKRPEPVPTQAPTPQPTTGPQPATNLAALQTGAGNAALAAAATSGSFPHYNKALPLQSTYGNAGVARALSRGEDRIQPKLTVSSPDDPLEREADRVADHVVKGGDSLHRSIAEAATPTLQRQEALTDKPREPPTKFPPQEEPKHGAEKEDEEKEKLVKGGLKAAGEFARRLWDDFSNSLPGKSILAANERDWKPILKFFEDFASTAIGKIIFGAAAGGAATGLFLGARSARDKDGAPAASPSGPPVPLAPKDEKFFALELNWDFISPPAGFTLKTPWIDSPKIGGGSSSSSSTALPPAPQLIKPVAKIPRICTPTDPAGDRGEAAARDAQIYGWLLWKQQQDEARMNEILRRNLQPPGEIWRPGQPYKFTPSQVSQVKPLFKREDGAEESHDPKAVEEGLRLAGQSLDPETRAFMEPRFGRDLSQVQIHTDAQAAKSAESVNALAYTVGRDVVFGAGQYQPATDSGRRLLAHELAHTIQQGAAGTAGPAVRTSDNKAPPPAFDTRASVQRLPVTRGSSLHPKLTIGAANDHYEQEADRVAQQVMSMPTLPSAVTGQATIQGQVPEEDEVAQTKPLAATITPLVQCAPSDPQGSFEPGADFESRLSTSGGGSPLPASTRAFMEPRFGADFSGVRLHTGNDAAQLNRAIGAQAFTHGRDIYLGEGKNDLESRAEKQLLAHELTHTIQQGAVRVRSHGSAFHRTPAASATSIPQLHLMSVVQRKPDDIDTLMHNDDWHGAAWTLAQLDPADIAARLSSMSSLYRRYLVEGARHGEGIWNTDAIVSAVYQISPRDAIIGSVRFFVWKHLWGKAGTYLCGLSNDDMRQVAIGLRLTIRDMQVMADEQADKAQAERLSLVLLGNLAVIRQAPQDLIGKGGEKLAEAWLLGDPLIGRYAGKKFKPDRRLTGHFHLVPADKWGDTYVKHSAGRDDPELGRPRTDDEARARSELVDGFHDQSELYVRQGRESPGTVIHEAIHFIAPDDFKSLYGLAVNEGCTEYFARLVAQHVSVHPSTSYPEQHAGVDALARLAGAALLADAFFTGNGNVVQNAVDANKGQGTFSKWVDAMQDDTKRKSAPDVLK
jgi:hypothetical protein